MLGRPADTCRVEIEALQGGLSVEQRRRLAHVAAAGCAHQQGGALGDVELSGLGELLPAWPARKAVLARDDELGIVQGGGSGHADGGKRG